MHLFEAIIDANHRAVAGDKEAGLHPADFENELPVIALTCIDPRLNAFFPNVLALPAEQFIWLRNAGNIIFDPMSSMMRTLALACAVKGGKEIAIIGHTDCLVGKTTTMQLLQRFKDLGIERHLLPENLNEFFGLFSSERQNVIKSCDIVRHSPLIGPKIPVHGLLLNIETGELEWIVNGYQTLDTMASRLNEPISPAGSVPDMMKSLSPFHVGEMKFPEGKIGEMATKTQDWLSKQAGKIGTSAQETLHNVASVAEAAERVAQQAAQYAEKHRPKPPTTPPKILIPPPIRPIKRR
ncbi:MAG TPA: carbonic anhydrase [Candidatus Acidoferrales bacterium]|nr:carbonic anhydrase [Candidatus Acidoferrales bacterium]